MSSIRMSANQREALSAISTVTGQAEYLSSTNGALNTTGGGSGGGGTQYTSAGPAVTNPTGNALIYFNASNVPTAVTTSNPLPITGTISVGSTTDSSTFTAGTSTLSPAGGVFNDGLTALTSGQQGTVRMTSVRSIHMNLRNNAGTETGTSTTPLRTDPTGTTTQPVSLTSTTITGTVASTQSGTWNITNISGTVSLPTGASTSALQTTGNASLATIVANTTNLTVNQGSTTSGQTGQLVQAAVTTGVPSYTTGQTSPLSLTPAGGLRVDASGYNVPVFQSTAANLNATVIGTGTFATQVTSLPTLPSGTNVIGHVITDTGSTTVVTGTVAVTESGTWNVGASSATGSAVPANAFYMGIVNGAGSLAGLGSSAIITDGNSGNSLAGAGQHLYNGTTFDRRRSASSASGTTGTGVAASGMLGFDGTNYQRAAANTSGNLLVGTATATINTGQKAVATTAVQVSATSTVPTNGILIGALSTNSASIFVGATGVTTTTGVELLPGASLPFTCNLNTIFIVSAASTTDKVWWNVT